MRLDLYLVSNGLASGRDRAKERIRKGDVLVNGNACTVPSKEIGAQDRVELTGETYFSRGELKLERAIEAFGVECKDKVCADIGASTGGFTYALLQHGARRVYAVDVGHGQLREELRRDERVVVREGVNARFLQPEDLNGEHPQLTVIDVSFISLKSVLPVVCACMDEDGVVIALFKPQFETDGKRFKNGVIKDPEIHLQCLREFIEFANKVKIYVQDATVSPIKGGEGNKEFLLLLALKGENKVTDLRKLVNE